MIKALSEDILSLDQEQQSKKGRLTLHTNEIIMRRKQFDIAVEESKGKCLNLTYDKRKILNPMVPLDRFTMIDTLPFGHRDLALYDTRVTMMEIITVDSDDDGEEETKEFEPPATEVIVVDSDEDDQA